MPKDSPSGMNRVDALTDLMLRAAKGDYEVQPALLGHDDNLGTLPQAVRSLVDRLREEAFARERAENALQESLDKYRHLEANIPGMVYTFALRSDGTYSLPYVTPASRKIFGLEPEETVRDWDRVYKLIHPADLQRFDESVRSSSRNLSPWREELRFVINGEVRWYDCMSRPVPRTDGEIHWEGIVLDITERKRAEEALRESEERFQRFMEHFPGIAYIKDHCGRILFANKGFAAHLGLNPADLVGKTDSEVLPPDFAKKITQHDQRILTSGGSEVIEESFGRRTWRTHKFCIDQPGGQPLLAGLTLDITERAQSEAKADHLNRVLRATRSVNELIIREKDRGSLLQGACDTLIYTHGYHAAWVVLTNDAGEVIKTAEAGLGERFIPLVEQLAHGNFPLCLEKAGSQQKPVVLKGLASICLGCVLRESCRDHGVMASRLESGSRLYGFISVCVPSQYVLDAEDQRLFQEVAGDIAYCLNNLETEEAHGKAEREKEDLQAQLLQSQKMEALGKLAGGIAHDFNNLLSVIMGYTSLAIRKLDAENPLRDMLSEVEQASRNAAKLTSQLLSFSRRKPVKREELNLNAEVNGIRKMIERFTGENVQLALELHPDLWKVFADAGTMDQVLINLAINARDAMPEGGTITVRTDNTVIDQGYCEKYTYARPGQFVSLSVADTGVGMDDETSQRIFEPFFTTKAEGKGTGLGLSVVYGIVKQHEGWISVESSPGKGTTFKIYLPALAEKTAEVQGSKEPLQPEYEGHGERILVVEDDDTLRVMLEEILSRQGYLTFCAHNADHALELFEQGDGDFDLVFSDVGLPGKSGVELVTELISRKPGLRVLLASGRIHDESQWQTLKEKGYPFLNKPYHPPDLFELIRNLLNRASARSPHG